MTWSGGAPLHLSPRGQRAQHLVNALKGYGTVEKLGGDKIPRWLAGNSTRTKSSWYRQLAHRLVHSVLVDKYELSVWRELHSWEPAADAAVLVAFPFSPLSLAARKLKQRRIPYVVDVGDPWILTNPNPESGPIKRWRAKRQERRVWTSAAGAIVTTRTQGDALKRLYPHLQVLVRANGYNPSDNGHRPRRGTVSRASGELHLAHYGSIYGRRVNFYGVFQRLAESGLWRKITLHQHGADWESALTPLEQWIDVKHVSPITWAEVVASAHMFDAAIVIGWRNPGQMPSKAVQYLTLPIPRVAMVTSDTDDSLAAYLADKSGWAVVDDASVAVGQTVADLISKKWTEAELAAPESESWEHVERLLGAFVIEATSGR